MSSCNSLSLWGSGGSSRMKKVQVMLLPYCGPFSELSICCCSFLLQSQHSFLADWDAFLCTRTPCCLYIITLSSHANSQHLCHYQKLTRRFPLQKHKAATNSSLAETKPIVAGPYSQCLIPGIRTLPLFVSLSLFPSLWGEMVFAEKQS